MLFEMSEYAGLNISFRTTDESYVLTLTKFVPPVPQRKVGPLDGFTDQMPQQFRMQSLAVIVLSNCRVPDALGNQIIQRKPVRI
jgi:hypothetical protein